MTAPDADRGHETAVPAGSAAPLPSGPDGQDDPEPGWDTCYHCQDEHDPFDHAGKHGFSPEAGEWEDILRRTPSIHRTPGLALPKREHGIVHDPSTPPRAAAGILLRHMEQIGTVHVHWSAPEGMDYTQRAYGSHAAHQPDPDWAAKVPGKTACPGGRLAPHCTAG